MWYAQSSAGWGRASRRRRGRFGASRPFLLLSAILLVGSAALAACGTPTQATIPSITLTAKDYAFESPQSLPGGLVSITLENQGKEAHQANIARLHDGVTREQLLEAVAQSPEAALGMVSFVGGPNIVDPGMRQTVVVDLPAGQYVALCFVSTPDGHTHVEKGMTSFFTVEEAQGAQPAEPGTSQLVALKDFSIDLPETLSAGTTTWKVWNNGSQPHELGLMKLADGKTMSDLEAFMQDSSGTPPFTNAGGIGALDPGKSGWATMALEKGNYVALCYVPDPSTGMAHFQLGMMREFTVQ